MGQVLVNMLNPIRHFEVLFTSAKLSKMFNLFSVLLLLPLLHWRSLLFLVLPNWFVLYSSDNPLLNGPAIYYGLLILPFLYYGALVTLGSIRQRWPKRGLRAVVALSVE